MLRSLVLGTTKRSERKMSRGTYTFSHMGFTYRGEWQQEADKSNAKIMHEIYRDGEYICHLPHSPYTFPNQSDVEHFIENTLIAEKL